MTRKLLLVLMVMVGMSILFPVKSYSWWWQWNGATIQTPQPREQLRSYPVEIIVQFNDKANPETFKARLNGRNITDKFEIFEGWARALVGPEDGLRVSKSGSYRYFGFNFLMTQIRSIDLRPDFKFLFFFVESSEASDSDGDGVPDSSDNCPDTANPEQKDADGDSAGDVCDICPNDPNNDADADGVCGDEDNCPTDPNKVDPGICGCSVADTDSDGDGTPDCNDNCPDDPNKVDSGVCGCGFSDIDTDGDGTADCNENCPNDATKTDPGVCGCGVSDIDLDGDGFADCIDICPGFDDKIDSDGDGIPDGCDTGDELPPDPADVSPELDSTVATDLFAATEFLYTGNNRIQTGMDPVTIEENRVAILRGKVIDRDGNPLSGVRITILNHPEYGQTLSREDGMFDLAVNGGGFLTVNYKKEGYLPAQRKENVPWQDWVWAPDVALIPIDTQITSVDLAQTSEDFAVAQGSIVSDDRGSRQATLLFPQGTQAEMVMPDGSTQSISTLSVRATEYSIGPNGQEAMPAELPPGIGYTYCVELSVDEAISAGAKDVSFSQPLFNYVENFLGFATGGEVPAYYYDQEKGVWRTSQNGLVIKIVGTSGGLADLDTDGDDVADDPGTLTALGITDEERLQLAGLYTTGQSLWRVPVNHFSTVDYNWPPVYPPDQYPSPPDVAQNQGEEDPCTSNGSIIECQNQTLGESVSIVGTPFSLNYRSSRTPGRKAANTLNIPLSKDALPYQGTMIGIELEVSVAGQLFRQSFPPEPNQQYTYSWDGKDAYGRDVQGAQAILVRLGYKYTAQRCDGSGECISDPSSDDILWSEWRGSVSVWNAESLGLGGWTLDVQHFYDFSGQTLWLGNGKQRTSYYFQNGVLSTVAGNGTNGYSGDGGPATQAQLDQPIGFSFGPDGSLYIADYANRRIRKVDPYGIISTVAGTGESGFSGDGGPALDAMLGYPEDVEIGADGSLYIADSGNARIRKVDPDGIITTIAGNGEYCSSMIDCGTGGPAIDAAIGEFHRISVGNDGSIYIGAWSHRQILRVGPDGILTAVAGVLFNYMGFGGDGGPALDALLWGPSHAVQAPDGSLYINDTNSGRVRKVSPDGIINTVAGNGNRDPFSGDGGPATDAQFYSSSQWAGLSLGLGGSFYIPDYFHYRIRRVGPDGIINTVVGTENWGYSPDGTPATKARISGVHHTEVGPDGNLYFSEQPSGSIRKVESGLPDFSFTDIIIASLDGSKLYVFNPSGKHMRTISSITGSLIYEFFYDGEGFLVSIEDAYGNVTNIERDGSGNPTAIVGPFGQTTALNLDTNGYLNGIVNPAGEELQFSYTDDGLLTSATDPNGNTSTYTYDETGRLILAENAAGGFQTLARTDLENGYEVTKTTEMGRTATYRVERLSTGEKRLINTSYCGCPSETLIGTDGSRTNTGPDGTVITIQQEPDPRFGTQSPFTSEFSALFPSGLEIAATQTQDATLQDDVDLMNLVSLTTSSTFAGQTSTDSYSASTQVFVSTSPAGRTRTLTIDDLGRPLKLEIPGLHSTNITYDATGRLSSFTVGSGVETRSLYFNYGPSGLLDTLTDPLGRSVDYERDAVGRVIRSTLPSGATVEFGFDAAGNLVHLTPPNRLSHNFAYDARNNLTTITPPSVAGTGQTSFVYNTAGDPTRITEPGGETITFAYDNSGRPNLITQTAGGTPGASYGLSYNTAGLLANIAGPGSQDLSYTYDGFLITGAQWSGPVTGSVTRSFDNALRLSDEQVNGGSTVIFSYDADDLLTDAGDLMITRDPENGLPTSTSLGAVADTWTYNGFGELVNYSATADGSSLYQASYERDALGRVVRKEETVGGAIHSFEYTYDLRGRLVAVTRNSVMVEHYTYDENGNRTSAMAGGVNVTATYDDQDRLLTYGTASFEYTPSGRLLRRTDTGDITQYDYDALGNLLSVTLPDGTTVTYLLDGADRRVGRQANGAPAERFLYSGFSPVAQLDASGAVVSRFIYAGGHVPAYLVREGVMYRIITDQVGSVRLVVNTLTGAVAQSMDYDTFGRVVLDTNPGFQPFGFAGGLYDADTRLVRFGLRDYDADTGRWTAKDPLGFAGLDTNLYGYVFNDPVNLIDPLGLGQALDIIGGIIGGISDVMLVTPLILNVSNSITNFVTDLIGSPQVTMEPNPIVAGWAPLAIPGVDPLVDINSFEFEVARSCVDAIATTVLGGEVSIAARAERLAALSARNAARLAEGRAAQVNFTRSSLAQDYANIARADAARKANASKELGEMTSTGARTSLRRGTY